MDADLPDLVILSYRYVTSHGSAHDRGALHAAVNEFTTQCRFTLKEPLMFCPTGGGYWLVLMGACGEASMLPHLGPHLIRSMEQHGFYVVGGPVPIEGFDLTPDPIRRNEDGTPMC